MSNLHPLFARITQIHGAPAPMTAAELEMHYAAIDAEVQADKDADGYGERNQDRALRMQMACPLSDSWGQRA